MSLQCFTYFVPFVSEEHASATLEKLQKKKEVYKIVFISTDGEERKSTFKGCKVIHVSSLYSSFTYSSIAECNELITPYLLLCTSSAPIAWGEQAFSRMRTVAMSTNAPLLYSDYYQMVKGERIAHPVIDYQPGSVRDDFDFGSVYLIKTDMFKGLVRRMPSLKYAGLYWLRLQLSKRGDTAPIFHIQEYLYTQEERDTRLSGEKQFDYLNPRNREVQIEMEKVFTKYLNQLGAYLRPEHYNNLPTDLRYNPLSGASVIIPVRNRVRTIGDAIGSALQQKCSKPFNVLVVDNHSTDGTSEVIAEYAAKDNRVIHIIPERDDLGIGGCWNLAIHHAACYDIAIQLDSDDLYSGNKVIQQVLDKFESTQCAMVIGSYRITDFNLNTLPPGIIDHKEWTDDNGRNNALRINGLGAPRAFYTPIVRNMPFPNTSYGEDYAMALAISREYRIERIYEVLYLCRRWEGNSDAAISVEKVNTNNHYKDKIRTQELAARLYLMGGSKHTTTISYKELLDKQMIQWPQAKANYEALKGVKTRQLSEGITLQYNPARKVSTGASIQEAAIAKRPCFLCESNRPVEQLSVGIVNQFKVLVNPYPIMPQHYTIVYDYHRQQSLLTCLEALYISAHNKEGLVALYNGPRSGASAPDHAHCQLIGGEDIPIFNVVKTALTGTQPLIVRTDRRGGTMKLYTLTSTDYPMFVIDSEANKITDILDFYKSVIECLPIAKGDYEPRLNVISKLTDDGERCLFIIIPRSKHRPNCYGTTQEEVMVSPGAIDMGGLVITPREEDFKKLTMEKTRAILQEVAIGKEEMKEAINKLKVKFLQ